MNYVRIPEDIEITQVNLVITGHMSQMGKPIFVEKRYDNGFIYIISGSATYVFDNTVFSVKEGNVFFLKKNACYKIELLSKEYNFLHVNFKLSEDSKDCFENGIYLYEMESTVIACFRRLETCFRQKNSMYRIRCKMLLYELIFMILQNNEHCMPNSRYRVVREAALYIEQHYADSDLTVDQLVSSSGISGRHFRRLFREVYRISPVGYLRQLRINHAKDILLNCTASITQTAEATGFTGLYYFSYAFKKETGLSPTEYVKQHHQYSY